MTQLINKSCINFKGIELLPTKILLLVEGYSAHKREIALTKKLQLEIYYSMLVNSLNPMLS